jgi:inorganic triphosphatase YgiF
MKKQLMARYNKETQKTTSKTRTMKTRSMTRKESGGFDREEYDKFHNNRSEYEKEQKARRDAGIKPIIICMGGPYSDAWYPPHN